MPSHLVTGYPCERLVLGVLGSRVVVSVGVAFPAPMDEHYRQELEDEQVGEVVSVA